MQQYHQQQQYHPNLGPSSTALLNVHQQSPAFQPFIGHGYPQNADHLSGNQRKKLRNGQQNCHRHGAPPPPLAFAHPQFPAARELPPQPPPQSHLQMVQFVPPALVGNGRVVPAPKFVANQPQQHQMASTHLIPPTYARVSNQQQTMNLMNQAPFMQASLVENFENMQQPHHHFLGHPSVSTALLPMAMPPPPMVALPNPSPAAMAAAHAQPLPPQMHHQQNLLHTPSKIGQPSPAIVAEPGNIPAAAIAGPAGGGDCWSTAVTGWEEAAMIKNKIGLVIKKRFRIVQSIASGSYGEIFVAEDLHSPGLKRQRVAVKFDGACRDNHLRYEYDVYKSVLYEDGNGKVEGFPQVYWYDHEYGHNIMVMELLGAPVASLFAFCDRKFARPTIVSLGEQMIKRIRHMHQRGFIHRDIKPENFLMGLPPGKESTLYLIDFGLARRYRYREGENRTLTHIPYRRGRNFIGTVKYASLNSHKNIELSRRDDLESLAYVLIELVNGQLPWKNVTKRNATTKHQASQRIRQLKEQTSWDDYCPCMAKFMRYCREIPFNNEPDYDKLLDLLQLVAVQPSLESSIIHQLPMSIVPSKFGKKKMTGLLSAAICCQTPETSEQAIQVNLLEKKEEIVRKENEEETNNSINKEVVAVQQSMQRQLSLNAGENASDFDEIGAATTTTSCSENELDLVDCAGDGAGVAGGVEAGVSTGTGTADDEDSQPTLQQEQQTCRKCRRLRDQSIQQQQQKRVKEFRQQSQPQQRQSSHQQHQRIVELESAKKEVLPVAEQQQFRNGGTREKPEQRKMCWQQARENNAERRFQYENKFSWALPIQAEPALLHPHNQHHQSFAVPPSTAGYQQQQPIFSSQGLPLMPAVAVPPVLPSHLAFTPNFIHQPLNQNKPNGFHQQLALMPPPMEGQSSSNASHQQPTLVQVLPPPDQYSQFRAYAPPAQTIGCYNTSPAVQQQPILYPHGHHLQPQQFCAQPGHRGGIARPPLQIAFVLPPNAGNGR